MSFWQSQKPPTFEREDWSLFRTLEGLQQRAGMPKNLLPRLVLKEFADDGLDNGAEVIVQSPRTRAAKGPPSSLVQLRFHLSYSCASPFGPALLVTQDPLRTSPSDSGVRDSVFGTI